MILLIDNYDSFVHNLARYLHRLGQPTRVVRNNAITVAEIRRLRPAAIVLSPGPCAPSQAGASLEIVRGVWREVPILGVCLGHQIIAEAFDGRVVRAPEVVHGRASPVHHSKCGVFHGLPSPFLAGRYHSLIVDPRQLPDCLKVSASTQDGIIMAIEHVERPILGWQFHPESVLTEHGFELLAAFLRQIGLETPESMPSLRQELLHDWPANRTWFQQRISMQDLAT